jgi:drug/metabolite transporter (DMT)-like permease
MRSELTDRLSFRRAPRGGPSGRAASVTARGAARGAASATGAAPRRDPLGYAIVIVSYLGMAGSAPLVAWAHAPAAIILMVRMAFASLALGVVFLRRPMLADWRRPGAAWRLVVMIAMSSLTLLLFFYAVLHTSVAIAMFLLFLMPLWVALIAPRVFHSPREPIVWPALGLALAGLAVILVPDLLGGSAELTLAGLLAALFTGFGYASYTISVKGLTKIVASSTVSMAEAAGDTLLVAPLALWQFHSTGYDMDGRAWIAAAVMGVACTAIPYTLWVEGTRRVRVEQVTILGYVEPVAGPLYAVFLVGQMPSVWTVLGGALILGAGLLVIVFGRGEGEASVAAASEPEPL